jgi:ABC-type phosphate transport system substrate-binding protein
MYGKQRVRAVVATLGILVVAGCSTSSSSSSSTSGSPAGGGASTSTPIASSAAVVKAKQQATACLQQTGTARLLSSAGRSQLVTCLEKIVPPAEREAFKNCMVSAGVSDQVWTKAGREKFTNTSLEACLNNAATATPSASLRYGRP